MLALLIASLGGWVAQEAANRIFSAQDLERVGWRILLSLAMGTGLWCAHVVIASMHPLPFSVGYNLFGTLTGWAAAMLFSALASWVIGTQPRNQSRVISGAFILAAGIELTSILGVCAIGVLPGPRWNISLIGMGGLIAIVGTGVSLGILHMQRQQASMRWATQALACLCIGLTAVMTQSFVIRAVDWSNQSFSKFDSQINAPMLSALTSVGSLALLITLWLALLIESRLRASLRIANSQLQSTAFTDLLTGLPNRLGFEKLLGKAAADADYHQSQLALLFINLDAFKPINEIYGHHGGDSILCEIASRLRSVAEPGDHLARLGGDEFLLLMTTQVTTETASTRARQILTLVSKPHKFEGREGSIACSIGIAMYPTHGAASVLITRADAAMRASKAAGGATFSFFEPRMINDHREQVELLQDLRGALGRNEFELFYQPKIDAPSGEITGAEALLRWVHPERGMISPMIFIPAAEKYGLINSIGAWVLEEACRQIAAWRKEGMWMRVAVNLSVHQLRQADLPDRISESLNRHQVNPSLLTCEITESVAMEDATLTRKLFERLAAVGVHISIDDFGTGYSSLSYLRTLPAGELKIDRSFVMDLETSSDARAVVDAVIKLAQALSLKVVAEGVETNGQNQILRSLGCDQLQGYFFAKPMRAKALALWATQSEGPAHIDFRRSLFDPMLPPVEP